MNAQTRRYLLEYIAQVVVDVDRPALTVYEEAVPPQNAPFRLRLKFRPDGRLAFASCG